MKFKIYGKRFPNFDDKKKSEVYEIFMNQNFSCRENEMFLRQKDFNTTQITKITATLGNKSSALFLKLKETLENKTGQKISDGLILKIIFDYIINKIVFDELLDFCHTSLKKQFDLSEDVKIANHSKEKNMGPHYIKLSDQSFIYLKKDVLAWVKENSNG